MQGFVDEGANWRSEPIGVEKGSLASDHLDSRQGVLHWRWVREAKGAGKRCFPMDPFAVPDEAQLSS